MSCRWSQADTLRFIELYKNRPELWDRKSELYLHKSARDRAYQSIINEMHEHKMTVSFVKNKIKNLRGTYHQVLRKIKDLRKKEAREYKPRLCWFEDFKIIMASVRKNTSDSEMSDDNSFHASSDTYTEHPVVTESYTMKEEYVNYNTSQELRNINFSSSNMKVYGTQLKSEYEPEEILPEQKASDPCIEIDEFQMFANNVAEQLRKLPLDRALQIQVDIQTLIAKERIKLHTQRSSNIKTESL